MTEPSAAGVPCPFCGCPLPRADEARCPRCKLGLDAQTRRSVERLMGPWFVMDEHNPYAPGVNWRRFQALIKGGRIGPNSIVRGPATGGFWKLAGQTPGVATQLGLCWSCQAPLPDAATTRCQRCGSASNGPTHWPAESQAEEAPTQESDQVALDLIQAAEAQRPATAPMSVVVVVQHRAKGLSSTAKVLIGGTAGVAALVAMIVVLAGVLGNSGKPPTPRLKPAPTSRESRTPTVSDSGQEPEVSPAEIMKQQRRRNVIENLAAARLAAEANEPDKAEKILNDTIKGYNPDERPADFDATVKDIRAKIEAARQATDEPAPEALARQRDNALRLFKLAKAREKDGELQAAQELLLQVLNDHHPTAWPEGAEEALKRVQKALASPATTPVPDFFAPAGK